MKTEPILARVNEILALSDAHTLVRSALEKLAADLADQVRVEAAASRGVGNAAAVIRRMLNDTKKNDGRRQLHYAWLDAEGRQCTCDGFRAFRLNEPLSLEPRPDDAGDGIDLDKIVPVVTADTHDALPMPSYADVKAHIALERAANGRKSTVLWDFGPGRPVVDAALLADLIAVLPDAAEIHVKRGPSGIISPLYAKSARGDALLLPTNPINRAERAARAEAAQRIREAAEMLRAYAAKIEHDARHCMSLDDFAALAALVDQP